MASANFVATSATGTPAATPSGTIAGPASAAEAPIFPGRPTGGPKGAAAQQLSPAPWDGAAETEVVLCSGGRPYAKVAGRIWGKIGSIGSHKSAGATVAAATAAGVVAGRRAAAPDSGPSPAASKSVATASASGKQQGVRIFGRADIKDKATAAAAAGAFPKWSVRRTRTRPGHPR
jgi:hypothetical protein